MLHIDAQIAITEQSLNSFDTYTVSLMQTAISNYDFSMVSEISRQRIVLSNHLDDCRHYRKLMQDPIRGFMFPWGNHIQGEYEPLEESIIDSVVATTAV